MADRFPSLDDFDAGQTEPRGEPLAGDPTDASDFLSRERALLGDAAEEFAKPVDRLATVEDADDDDLLGGGGGFPSGTTGGEEMLGFEDAFPEIDTTNDHMAPGGTITGAIGTLPYLPGAPPSYSTPTPRPDSPEPDVIREWRERRDAAIAHRDDISNQRKQATIKAAQEAIDDFYENYNNKKEKDVARTRREAEDFLNSRDDTTSGGTSWERIAKLVDLSGKGARGGGGDSEKARFRELLLSLRKDEKAPGASGY